MLPADSSPSRPGRASLVGLAIALAGLAVLVVTVRRAGWPEIRTGLGAIGGWFGVVVLLGTFRFLARARSWVLCAARVGAGALTSGRAFTTVLAADAVGNLTPLGLLASEPTKVLLLRSIVPTGPALTSVALDNAFYSGSVVAMLAAGAWMLVRETALPDGLRLAAQAVLAAVAIGAAVGAWAVRRQPAILSRLAQLAARVTGRAARSPDVLHDMEARFYGVTTWPRATVAAVVGWQAVFHAAAVTEVWLILSVLSGWQTTLAEAFVLETTGRLIAVLFKVVPFRIGVDEAGAAVVAAAVGVPVTDAVAMALVRKLRILVLNAAGLFVLARARR